ncbi:hypothetical protein A3715_00165 [Oleiphilus sp. HI0009]|nr:MULTISPECIES: hypothetical protein [unclassified Oleiphilus]KZX82208.1 hypothetical protein A3715_00165 [Oleiphilus sp. HI0009]KZY62104.1 hypothetical protein A3738_13065 [Oleiphilus sp. HI0066]KZY71183.1 hypothetical protein A3739_17190 [Oleiphilus sp. HI0067]KZY73675.1 hypothetical protein A3739_15175 [Oleiphilus sp. HI0067]KZZ59696.1 hypothetical protein A3762_16510 [Oleiphilus sp. HI0125]
MHQYARTLIILLSIIALFWANPASSKPLANLKKLEQATDLFMEQVAKGDSESALNLISAYAGVNPEQFAQRSARIIQDMQRIESSAGKALSYAKVDTKSVGEHLYKVRYLLKFRQAALVWEMNFYQPDQGWYLVDVNLSTDINALFQ